MASIADRVHALVRRLRAFGHRRPIVRWLALICALAIFSGLFEASHLRERVADAYERLSGALLDVRPRAIVGLYIAALSPPGSLDLPGAPPVGHWAATCFGLCDLWQDFSQLNDAIGHALLSSNRSDVYSSSRGSSGGGFILLYLLVNYIFLFALYILVGSFAAFADMGYHLIVARGLLPTLAVMAHFAIGFWLITWLQRQWRMLGAVDADDGQPGRESRYYRVFKPLALIGCCGWPMAAAMLAARPPLGDDLEAPLLIVLVLVGWISVVAIMTFRDASGRKRIERLFADYTRVEGNRLDCDAIAHSDGLLKVDPKNADARYHRGMAYANKYFGTDVWHRSVGDYKEAISDIQVAAHMFLKRDEFAKEQEARAALTTLEAGGRPGGILAIFDFPLFPVFRIPFTPVWTVIIASATCWLAQAGLSLVDNVAGQLAALASYGVTLGGISWALFSKAVEERADKLLERVIEG